MQSTNVCDFKTHVESNYGKTFGHSATWCSVIQVCIVGYSGGWPFLVDY